MLLAVPSGVQGLGLGYGQRAPGPRLQAGRRRPGALAGPAEGGARAQAGRRRAFAVSVAAGRGAAVDLPELPQERRGGGAEGGPGAERAGE